MAERILTSHAGSLPRPEQLIALNSQRADGELADEDGYRRQLEQAVADVVARQKEIGIDLVNDGEYGHAMGTTYDYGAWWSYVFPRLGGLELVETGVWEASQAREGGSGEIVLATMAERRDWNQFSDAYSDPNSGAALPDTRMQHIFPACRGPITYVGQEALAARHRRHEGGAGGGRPSRRASSTRSRRRAARASQTSSTPPTMSCSTPAPTRCARSTRRSSTRA